MQRTEAEVDKLAHKHIGLVFSIARQVAQRNLQFDREDMLASGYFGLVKACRKYDESKGYTFPTFAAYYIRGHMLDEIRSSRVSNVSRRSKGYQVECMRASESISQETFAPATSAQVAKRIGVDAFRLLQMERCIESGYHIGFKAGCEPCVTALPDDDDFETEEIMHHVREAFKHLTTRERQVMERRYLAGMRQTEVAKSFGITKSAVCQVERRAITKLRVLLADIKVAA